MKILSFFVISLIPYSAFAASGNLNSLIVEVGNIIEILIPIAAALALLVFFFGIAKFMLAGGDEEKMKAGKRLLVWGVVALFVISTLWGIITVLQTMTGTGNIRQIQSNFGGTIWNTPISPTLPPPP
ncbi:MAG: hypothetical protein A2741_01480 [Candidatus Zambryskibacteria bacterium RIFCSPHIGHO2_01_FULL_43_27]|uniref:Uncharacterized protein n=1 Tax=Candidatus Zambryskibacteria bacterium RIFCSPLOWO2_01_FULL_43_17 TaxID=1802760 RepID=A0A1G2U1C1_9BACT|nr:MAG: hypothetical protein A2741_01480 [Candidatus Zambryskibacteria bacterium RIFCSPHIGHO2_01_FULL_43_27]OHA99449.1 MAG: hypothetical protein A3E93_02590 [Candidatus Zambryskibacteria bacterium RIFCSPHIGHO2_12_FULL_43_12b]OHB03284.1 MAG: hypothetical protein A2920_00210 [Candidatus Zambryskibacteria bacterium RIFCSPLOWO2_01_FULL_43_17]